MCENSFSLSYYKYISSYFTYFCIKYFKSLWKSGLHKKGFERQSIWCSNIHADFAPFSSWTPKLEPSDQLGTLKSDPEKDWLLLVLYRFYKPERKNVFWMGLLRKVWQVQEWYFKEWFWELLLAMYRCYRTVRKKCPVKNSISKI